MASAPRIVAELGRPETPDETAARKAEASRAYRSSKTFRNLVVALAVTLGLMAVIVLGVPRGSLEEPVEADIPAAAAAAAQSLGRPVLAPEAPDGWRANSARLEGGVWRIVLAPADGFVSIAQGFDVGDAWPAQVLGGYAPDGAVTIDGIEWDRYDLSRSTESGNISYALATTAGADTVLVYGSMDAETAAVAAQTLTDQIRELREEAP